MEGKNIQFNYLYRDAANYKLYNSLIFSNKENLSLEFIEKSIQEKLIDKRWFYPQKWNVPLVEHYPYDQELDVDWYEFESVEQTEEKIMEEKDIKDFLTLLPEIQTYS